MFEGKDRISQQAEVLPCMKLLRQEEMMFIAAVPRSLLTVVVVVSPVCVLLSILCTAPCSIRYTPPSLGTVQGRVHQWMSTVKCVA